MTTTIANELFDAIGCAVRKLDLGGIVEDAKDVGFLLFTPKEKKIQKYYEDIDRALSNPDVLDKQGIISIANACFMRRALMVNFWGTGVGDPLKYAYCLTLQRLSESMIRNFPPRPYIEAQYREKASLLRAIIG